MIRAKSNIPARLKKLFWVSQEQWSTEPRIYVLNKVTLQVEQEVDLGSHTLFICEPTEMAVLSDIPSCTYAYYQDNIKPKPQPVGTTPKGETIWKCTVCGYEYVGEELPDDFICPICKHVK